MKQEAQIQLIVEKGDDGQYWGRCSIGDDLLTESAASIEELETQMRQIIYDFHGIEPVNIVFEVEYDLGAFFEQFDFLKISRVAEQADINSSLMRQYATGAKYPGQKQVKKIEQAIHDLGQRLLDVSLAYESV